MMIDVTTFDRAFMGFSLGVHIIFAVIGIALPMIIFLAEVMFARTGDNDYRVLARRLATVFLITFAVGTASGTIVALELLFLWPNFMALVSQVAILPVIAEVFVFFTEAIFIAAYLYYREKLNYRYAPALIMLLVGTAAALSGAFITMLNSFMNTPVGFNIPTYLATGAVTDVNPLAVFNSPSSTLQVVHVILSSYFAGTFIFIGYFSFRYLRTRETKQKEYYKKSIMLMFLITAIVIAPLIITGSLSAVQIYQLQPEKFAAIEADLVPQASAPEYIGGILVGNTLQDYITIPHLQSILLGNYSAIVPGLVSYPMDTWPPLFVHDLFDILVFFGFALGFFILYIVLLWLMKRDPFGRRITHKLFMAAGLVAILLVEVGWTMEEVARQPWIIYNVMLVSQAANPSSTIPFVAVLFLIFYIIIIPVTLLVLKRIFDRRPLKNDLVSRDGPIIY
jgi:cytochrome bd ubiquinol oxidase subunit I